MRSIIKTTARGALAGLGYRLQRLESEHRLAQKGGYDPGTPLPVGAEAYLRPDNPRLLELQQRYGTFESPVGTHTQWLPALSSGLEDLRYFRGDNAYVWQFRNVREHARLKYYLYARSIRDLDQRGLLGNTLTEDGLFGCFTFHYENMPTVSRDLLDSISELDFLDRHWDLFNRSGVQILDIGAGYGRLAHRMLTAAPGVERYWCIDAIPRSTFLCEYYLAQRHLLNVPGARAEVVPLDRMDSVPAGRIDLAVNIHSFSEMSHAAVEGWLQWLAQLQVPWLLVVPNHDEVRSKEADGSRRDCSEILERAGFRLAVTEPVLRDPDVRELFGVHDKFLLYRRD